MQSEDRVREKAWVVAVTPGSSGIDVTGLDELNACLARGYRVTRFERLSEGGGGEPSLAFVVTAKRIRDKRK